MGLQTVSNNSRDIDNTPNSVLRFNAPVVTSYLETSHHTITMFAFISILVCMFITILKDFDRAAHPPKCDTVNYLPVLSASLLLYAPQRQIWLITLMVSSFGRLFEVHMMSHFIMREYINF